MKLKYVVITSVDRDDLPDRGAGHFAECVKEVRALNPGIKMRFWFLISGRITQALEKLKTIHQMCSTTTWKMCHVCIKKFVRALIISGL